MMKKDKVLYSDVKLSKVLEMRSQFGYLTWELKEGWSKESWSESEEYWRSHLPKLIEEIKTVLKTENPDAIVELPKPLGESLKIEYERSDDDTRCQIMGNLIGVFFIDCDRFLEVRIPDSIVQEAESILVYLLYQTLERFQYILI